jgi:hypothetical protein
MIKNIIILALILALAGMMWRAVPDDQKGSVANIEALSQQAQEVKTKVADFWPPMSQERVSLETTTSTSNTSPVSQEKEKETEPPSASTQGSKPVQTMPEKEDHRKTGTLSAATSQATSPDAASEEGDEKEGQGEARAVVAPEPPISTIQRSTQREPLPKATGKEDLSQGELSEILSLLKRAKEKLRNRFFSVQPAPPARSVPSDWNDSTPIKKKFDDGPNAQG